MVCFACKDSKIPNIIYIGVRKNKEFVTSRKVFRLETKEKKQIHTNYPQIMIKVHKNKQNPTPNG